MVLFRKIRKNFCYFNYFFPKTKYFAGIQLGHILSINDLYLQSFRKISRQVFEKKKQNERTYVRMYEGEFIGPTNEVGGSNRVVLSEKTNQNFYYIT